jgi:hypothetical protein
MHFPPNTRVVSINFAYGYFEQSKPCAGTVLGPAGEDSSEVAWDDGDTCAEATGDIVPIGVRAGDPTFGAWSPNVTIVNPNEEG